MRVRVLAAVAAVLVSAGLAPAQWAITPAPRQPPTTGLDGTLIVYAGYPSGWAAGYDYARLEAGVRRPDGTWVRSPVGGMPVCVSATGRFCGLLAGGAAYRWELATGAVEPVGVGLAGASPVAVADDGAAVLTGAAGGWLVGAVVAPGRSAAVVVPCQSGYLAPGWGLFTADAIEPNGDGTYTVRGGGSRGGFALTGPLPE